MQKLIDQECLDYAINNPEITFIAYSPLLLGVYTRSDVEMLPEFNTTDNQMRLTMLTRVADEVDATKNQVVLAWMLQNTPKVIPLIAASKVDQLQENLGALRVNLTAQLLEQLNHDGD